MLLSCWAAGLLGHWAAGPLGHLAALAAEPRRPLSRLGRCLVGERSTKLQSTHTCPNATGRAGRVTHVDKTEQSELTQPAQSKHNYYQLPLVRAFFASLSLVTHDEAHTSLALAPTRS